MTRSDHVKVSMVSVWYTSCYVQYVVLVYPLTCLISKPKANRIIALPPTPKNIDLKMLNHKRSHATQDNVSSYLTNLHIEKCSVLLSYLHCCLF